MKNTFDTSGLRRRLEELRNAGIDMVMVEPPIAPPTPPTPPAPTPPPPPPTVPPDPAAPPVPPGTVTQEQLNTIIGQRLAAQRAQIESDLGMAPADAKKILAAADEERRKNLDAATLAAEDRKSAELALVQAAEMTHSAAIVMALAGANVPAAVLPTVAKLIDVPRGSDQATIAAAIEQLKATVPGLFASTVPPAPSAPGSVPPPPPASPGGADDAFARGAARAVQQKREYTFQ